MKNLKKALVLVLAFAMIFSMFTMNASAASFSDDDAIVNTEAVGAMAELGIINGYEDGTFLPTQVVTRAEMCKMICIAMNGGKAPILDSSTVVFSDTKGHWANSYISYCFGKGIVSGDAGKGGTFRPDATVTGIEAAKMMLVALGYNSAIAGFTGADWANNVSMAANDRSLFTKLGTLNVVAGLSRDNAAQLIYNGLSATMVKYENVLSTDANGQLTSTPRMVEETTAGGVAKTILSDKFKVKFDYGQVTSVGKETFTIEIDTTLGTSTTSTVAGTAVPYTKVASDYSALLGQSVKVMFKATDEVLGVVALEKNKVASANLSAVAAVSGSTTKVKFGGTEYTLDNGTAGTVDTLTIGANGVITASTATATALAGNVTSYNTIKFIDNDADNKYEYAVITVVTPAKVTYASSTEIIAGSVTYKYSANAIADGIAKDDYVTIVGNPFKANNVIAEVSVATGKITGYKATNHQYQIDSGAWYYSGTGAALTPVAGNNAKFVAVNGVIFYAAKVDAETSLSGVVMVIAADSSGVNKNAKILKADGTKAVVAVDETSTGAIVPSAGVLYTYTVTDYGYKFKAVSANIGNNTWTGGAATDTLGSPVATIAGTGIADDAVIFVWNGATDGKVITGKQLKTLNVSTTAGTVLTAGLGNFKGTSNGLTRIVMAGVKMATTALPTIGDTAGKYALVVSASYQVDADYITYEIWNGTSVERVKEKQITTRASKALIAYSSIVDGVIKDVTTAGETKAFVNGLVGDYVWLNGESDASNKFKLTASTVYMYYDSSATAAADIGKTSGTLVLADKNFGTYTENVKYILNGTDVKFILIDVKNKLADATTYTTAAGSATGYNVTTSTTSAAAGALVTYTITSTTANETAKTVRVTMGAGTAYQQVALVSMPDVSAAAAGTMASTTVSFTMPAANNPAVVLARQVSYSAIAAWTGPVNGVASATGAVASGTYFEGDTVNVTVTTVGAATGAAVITLTGTTTGLTAVAPATTTNVTTAGGTHTLAAGAVAQVYPFTITATFAETAPAISIT